MDSGDDRQERERRAEFPLGRRRTDGVISEKLLEDVATLRSQMESAQDAIKENTKAVQDLALKLESTKSHCSEHCVSIFASKEQVKKWEKLFFYFECLVGSAIVVAILSLVIKKGG
jgi:hypothetical protein